MTDQAATSGGIRHVAWFYRTAGEYLAAVRELVRSAAKSREPVLVAVPAARLPPGWAPQADLAGVRSVDAAVLGRNPARMMPVLRAFADEHRGRAVRIVSELAWTGRSAAELGELARYEQAVNLALGAATGSLVCLYNAAELPGWAISRACASHPRIRQDGRELDSPDYSAARGCQEDPTARLTAPPGAQMVAYTRDLRPVRAQVAAAAARAGLSAARRTDLVIAASEVAANTIKHTSGGGVLQVWVTEDEVLCQLEDSGHIADPLAGYGRPAGDVPGGQGLWLVNQVCDLAEIRTGELGTTIRLHMDRDVADPDLREGARAGQGYAGWQADHP